MVKRPSESIDDILSRLEERKNVAVALKNDRGVYTYANNGWSEIAEAPAHKITGKNDDQLPWSAMHSKFIQSMDATTKYAGHLTRADRINHFHTKRWMHTTTERLYLPNDELIVCMVKPSHDDHFCQLANQVTEKGLAIDGLSLSIKQMYLLHQLLFHVSHKQIARELSCSPNRVNQQLRNIRDKFQVDDNKELVCALSAAGLFPLLEHFDLLFRYGWIPLELKYQ